MKPNGCFQAFASAHTIAQFTAWSCEGCSTFNGPFFRTTEISELINNGIPYSLLVYADCFYIEFVRFCLPRPHKEDDAVLPEQLVS